jgi:hypothetical protein
MKKILITNGYGAGWSTCNPAYPECINDPTIIAMVEANTSPTDIKNKAEEMWTNGYWSGSVNLKVVEVEEATEFRITGHDGWENIMYKTDYNWSIL